MISPFHHIVPVALDDLAHALEIGRLSLPVVPVTLDSYVPPELQQQIAAELNRLYNSGDDSRASVLHASTSSRGAQSNPKS